jgi:hypothetical protein
MAEPTSVARSLVATVRASTPLFNLPGVHVLDVAWLDHVPDVVEDHRIARHMQCGEPPRISSPLAPPCRTP